MSVILLTSVIMVPVLALMYLVLVFENRKKKDWVARRLMLTTDPVSDFRSLKWWLQVPAALGGRTSPSREDERRKLRSRLSQAGFRAHFAPEVFSGMRVIAFWVPAVILTGLILIFSHLTLNRLALVFFLSTVGYLLPPILLNRLIARRKKKIFKELPNTLDLMVLCIQAGLGFEMALMRVSRELKQVAPILSREFAHYFFETRGGVARNDALANMKNRNREKGLDAFVDVVLQSLRFGTDIASALRVHSESMRTERQQIAEEQGARVAVKLTLPLVFLVLPALLIVILGPAALRLINYFSS